MASIIDVTIRFPFSEDRTLRISTDVSVSELILTVQRLVPDVRRQGTLQCIMYRGRVLDEEQTLSALQIPNDAVLQMMPRPSRFSHRLRGDDHHMQDPFWEGSEDHEHEHDHIHEHVHTNVLISHVGFNNRRAQYSDIREMLVSLFQALGFSTDAINSTATVAAALLTSFDSGVEREQPSRSVLEAAWSVVRTVQERMSTFVTNSNMNRSQPQATNTEYSNLPDASVTRSRTTENQVNPSLPPLRSTTAPAQVPPSQPGTSEALRSFSATHPSRFTFSRPPERGAGGSSTSNTSAPSISVLPANLPLEIQDESDQLASARTADRLLPALVELLSNLEHRLNDAPSFVDVIGRDRTQDMTRLTELVGATAGAMTSVATLMSSALPGDRDDEGDVAGGSGLPDNSSPQQQRQSQVQSDSAREANPGSSNQEGDARIQRSVQRQTGSEPTQATIGVPQISQRVADTNRMDAPRNTADRRGQSPRSRILPNQSELRTSSESEEMDEERNFDAYEEMNAGFLLRFLAYFYYSLAGSDSVDDCQPEDNDRTAIDVLTELYAFDRCEEPLNPFLRVLYYVMDMLTPLEFHKVCRGDFSPIAEYRHEVWDIIKEELSEVADDSIAPDDFEEFFVFFMCEKLHMFIHIFDAHNRDNEGAQQHSGEGDICRHTMHFVHRMTLRLLDILTGDTDFDEFAARLRDWFENFFAGMIHSLGEQRGQDWDSTTLAFRQASNEVGVAVVGGQCSIIFPLILNLFLRRARAAYDRINSESNQEWDLSRTLGDDRQDSEAQVDRDQPDPELGRQSHQRLESQGHRGSTPSNLLQNYVLSDDDSIPDLVSDSEDSGSKEDEALSNLGSEINFQSSNSSSNQGVSNIALSDPMEVVDRDIDLDDQDFDDIVAELSRELGPNVPKQTRISDDPDAEFKEIAMELEREAAAGPSSGDVKETGDKGTTSTERASSSFRGSSRAAHATSMRSVPHLGPNLSTGRPTLVGSSSVGHTSFSSTAVPVARRRANYSGSSFAQPADEFDVLGRVVAKRWRSVVQNDRSRLSDIVYSPLSRGYRYDLEPKPTLSDDSALKIIEQGLEVATREVQVTASERKELESILRDSSAECLHHVESEIRSRILEEDNFDNSAYPSAASRFLEWTDMPE